MSDNKGVTISWRIAGIQPFTRTPNTEDGRQATHDVGFVTYSDDDTNYQVSSFRVGHRCDHLWDALGADDRLDTNNPLEADRDLVTPNSTGLRITHRDGNRVVSRDSAEQKEYAKKRDKKSKKSLKSAAKSAAKAKADTDKRIKKAKKRKMAVAIG